METKEKYTITNASKILNVSRVTLYKYLGYLKKQDGLIEEESKTFINSKGMELLRKLNIGKKLKDIINEIPIKDDNSNVEGTNISENCQKDLAEPMQKQNNIIQNIVTPENFKIMLKELSTEYNYLQIEIERKNNEISELKNQIIEKDNQIIKLSNSISDFLTSKLQNKSLNATKNKTFNKNTKNKNASLFKRIFS